MPDRPNHPHRHRFPSEIISYAVWLYYRFPLSHRDVEKLLSERGIQVSYETVRRWVAQFGPYYPAELRNREARPSRTWHLDEMAVRIGGRVHWLWRAVDEHGATRRQRSASTPLAGFRLHSARDLDLCKDATESCSAQFLVFKHFLCVSDVGNALA